MQCQTRNSGMRTAVELFPDPPFQRSCRFEEDDSVKKIVAPLEPSPDQGIDSPSNESPNLTENKSPSDPSPVPGGVTPPNSIRPTLDASCLGAGLSITQIPGVSVVSDASKAKWIRDIAAQLCGYEGQGFPGTLATPLSGKFPAELAEAPYKVTWKSDGVRLLLLITNPGETFLLSEDNTAFKVSGLCFPYGNESESRLFTTLLDGEMVFDQDGGRITPRYLVRDILHFRLEKVGRLSFNHRTTFIERDIIDARVRAVKAGVMSFSDEPFSIRKKDHFPIEMAGKILAPKFRSQVLHKVEGLVFQPIHKPYAPGACDSMFEWELPAPSANGEMAASQSSLLEFVRKSAAKQSRSSFMAIQEPNQPKRRRED